MSDYPNSGTLRPNKFKKHDKQPAQTGQADVTCPKCKVESKFHLSAWLRGTFLNIKFQSDEDRAAYRKAKAGGTEQPDSSGELPPGATEHDDVPF